MEEAARIITIYSSHILEIIAAMVIAVAIVKLVVDYVRLSLRAINPVSAIDVRIHFGSAIAVSLELLLGADVLATAIAPSWNDIGKLAAIATLRTALNYFLGKELNHSQLPR